MSLQERVAAKAEQRRWLILVVLCFSLLVIVLDNSMPKMTGLDLCRHIRKEPALAGNQG